ncbi:hypothetical protein N9242_00980 [Vicingaceae bacterium]|nr:hypothetical protein [Vicingaceae bacterium]
MSEIIYNARIITSDLSSTLDTDISATTTGQSFSNSFSNTELKTINDPQSLVDGWDSEQIFTQTNEEVFFNNVTRIQDKERYIPVLNGPVITASNEVRVDSDDFENYIGLGPALGVKSAGTHINSKAFIFKRERDRLSIEKEYQYTHINSIKDKLKDNQFTELDNDGQNFYVFQIHSPISVSRYRNSSLQVTQQDYLLSSFNYKDILDKYNIEENNFLEMCDYVSIPREGFTGADENIDEWVFEEYGMNIYTKYFPIYSHITVIARYVINEVIYDVDDITILERNSRDNLYQIGISPGDDVDTISGRIKLGSGFTDNVQGTLYGFYIFYGTVPAVYVDTKNPSIRLEKILQENKELSYISIDNSDTYGNVSLSNSIISIKNGVIPKAENTVFNIPLRNKKFFLEPSSNVYINNSYVKLGEKFWISNEGSNIVEFKAPVHILEMIEPTILDGANIYTNSTIVSDMAAVYGLFQDGTNIRATLAAVTSTNIEGITTLSDIALGYGEGPYGAGGYGQGEIETIGTSIFYSTASQIFDSSSNTIGVQVRPADIGYEIVLPAWAKQSTIEVKEVHVKTVTPFTDWKYIEPDILILDKEKVDDEAIYSITFEVAIKPIISSVSISNNTVSLGVVHDPFSIYKGFKGYFLLHSKDIDVKIGYIDGEGVRQYFSKNLTINMVLEDGYLERVVTGTKTILL